MGQFCDSGRQITEANEGGKLRRQNKEANQGDKSSRQNKEVNQAGKSGRQIKEPNQRGKGKSRRQLGDKMKTKNKAAKIRTKN